MRRGLTLLFLLSLSYHARADSPDDWLGDLQERVAGASKVVVQVHVPLCSNEIIRCGKGGLGDGDDPGKNLYWGTSGGFKGWFGRKGSGWKQVAKLDAHGDVLETRVWKRVAGGKDVYVVAQAWRGSAIDAALAAYLDDLYSDDADVVKLDDGSELDAGGAAHVVAYVGHNRLMDVDQPDWDALAEETGELRVKGTIAIACHTYAYMGDEVPAPNRVPLLMTRDYLFAGAHAFEGAVTAFVEGKDYAGIRDAAAGQYAAGEGKDKKRVKGAFTNPGDRRWGK